MKITRNGWIAIGTISALLLGGGIYWRCKYVQKKQEKGQKGEEGVELSNESNSNEDNSIIQRAVNTAKKLVFTPVSFPIKKGSKHEEVKAIQIYINTTCIKPPFAYLEVDGVWGDKTEQAIKLCDAMPNEVDEVRYNRIVADLKNANLI